MELKLTVRLLIIAGASLILFSSCSGSGVGFLKARTKVRLTPKHPKDYMLSGEDVALKQGYFKDRERWVVFSDRTGNTTYKSPRSEVQRKSLGFMDACYVIRAKGDYLELVKYDPKLLKNPHKGIIDLKSAEYLGWAHKSRLLLWRMALQEQHTGFTVKGITCFKNAQAISTTGPFTTKDSLLLFSAPVLRQPADKCLMEDLFYIYKQSEDGSQYLVGRLPQATPDNRVAAVNGWISSDLLKVWGERSFFTHPSPSDDKRSDTAIADIVFYNRPALPADTIPADLHNVCCPGGKSGQLLERIYPVQGRASRTEIKGMLKTGLLVDALDRSQNEVINVLGNKIPYDKFYCLLACQRKANIVFVVDGNEERSMTTALTVVQRLSQYFDTSEMSGDCKYGAVLYKNGSYRACDTATRTLSTNYPDIQNFFMKCKQDGVACSDGSSGGVFGLSLAIPLLMPYTNETNIIILIGNTGVPSYSNYTDITDQLSAVNARMLIYQTYGGLGREYSDFFVQGKNMIERSAAVISEKKKEKLVNPDDLLNLPDFTLIKGDSGIYSLDYPKKAMSQGFMLFPESGQVMQSSFLIKAFDTLLLQINTDNKRMEQSLKKYFSAGSAGRNTSIHAPYQAFFPGYALGYLPAPFLKEALGINTQPFYIPAWVENKAVGDSASLKYGLLVSASEYEEIGRVLSVFGEAGDAGQNRKKIYRHMKRAVKDYRTAHHTRVGSSIGRMSLASSIKYLTGYQPINPLWEQRELRMVKNGRMNKAEVLAFLGACRDKGYWLTNNAGNSSISFINNGQRYYWLTAANLP